MVRRYQEKVYWLSFRMMQDHYEADEITQDVFIKLFHSASEFRGESTLYTWLYRITTNVCLNALRKKKVRSFLRLDEVDDFLPDREVTPDELVELEEQKSALEKAIKKLPEKQKAVFVLRYYEGKSYEEISQILKTSVGGLKANYFHALKKIGDVLKKQNED